MGHKKTYPDWSKKNTLLAILAHEIGHILGTEHVPGTLMADDFANRLQNAMFSSPKFSQDLLKIDVSRELLSCFYKCYSPAYCDVLHESNPSYAKSKAFYAKLLGRPISGDLKLTLVKRDSETQTQKSRLHIEDSIGSQIATLEINYKNFGPEYAVFKHALSLNAAVQTEAAPSAFIGQLTMGSHKHILLFKEKLGLSVLDISNPIDPLRIFHGFFRRDE